MLLSPSYMVGLNINESEIEICSLIASKLRVLQLFANLKPHAQSTATKSQAYSDENQQFTAQEVKHLLAEGTVELSSSSWQVQVVRVKDEFDCYKKECVWTTQTLSIYLQSLMCTHCQELKP